MNMSIDSWLPKKSNNFVPALDGIRGIAILLVVPAHLFTFNYVENFWARIAGILSRAGWLGVPLFFVLSGFLICGGLAATQLNLKRYGLRRAAKILPPFYISVLIFAITRILHGKDASAIVDSAIYTALFLFIFKNPDPIISAIFWSLGAEVVFYLLAPLIFRFLPPSTVERKLLWAGLTLILLGNSFRYFWAMGHIFDVILSQLSFFGWGTLAAWAVRLNGIHHWKNIIAWAGSLIFSGMFLTTGFIGASMYSNQIINLIEILGRSFIFTNFIGFSAALIVTAAYLRDSFLARLLSFQPLVLIGLVSYEWYLFHNASGLTGKADGSLIKFAVIAVSVAFASLLFSIFIYRKISLPILKAAHK